MGSVFSSIMMMTGSVASGVLSAIAARAAATKDWSKAKMYAYIALGVAVVMALVSLALFIRSKMSATAAMDIAPGFDIAAITLVIVLLGMAVMDIFAIVEASSSAGQATRKSEEFSAGSAALGFGGLIISLVLIVVLM